MSGFLGSLFGGSSGSSKTNRSNVLWSMGNLKNVFNWALPTAESGVNTALNYFSNIASGNRTAVRTAAAPQINAATAASDASARQLASSGTARGGGVAAANQRRGTDLNAAITNALFGARGAAAGQAGAIGGQTLGAAAGAATGVGDLAARVTPETDAQNQAAGEATADLIMGVIGMI